MERRAKARRCHMSNGKNPNNLRTALILLSVALAFFLGLFIKRIYLG